MAARRSGSGSDEHDQRGIVAVGVRGFKSIHQYQEIEIRPLTVLAGVNSAGKSSILQPLLLMKQTLEAPYDPGPLLLDGPHVSISAMSQILARHPGGEGHVESFTVRITLEGRHPAELAYSRDADGGVKLAGMTGFFVPGQKTPVQVDERGAPDELKRLISPVDHSSSAGYYSFLEEDGDLPYLAVIRDRFLLGVAVALSHVDIVVSPTFGPGTELKNVLARVIHLPAFRGNPARTYPAVGVEERYPGPFPAYTAGVAAAWQNRGETAKLDQLRADLAELRLTADIEARRLDDARVELLVGRLPGTSGGDMVNIADVGFGVSQTLPVVVALLVARPGQLVYLEQPEIHLHPRAQVAFVALLRRAAVRGVRVVVETHSSLLVRGIQTAVAEGGLRTGDVVLHWFTRDDVTGHTKVTTGTLDAAGGFGDWPEDFDEVNLDAEARYLDAAARRDAATHAEAADE